MQETANLIEDKVDWKGRPARKDKHGGARTSLLVLGKLNECFLTFHTAMKICVQTSSCLCLSRVILFREHGNVEFGC